MECLRPWMKTWATNAGKSEPAEFNVFALSISLQVVQAVTPPVCSPVFSRQISSYAVVDYRVTSTLKNEINSPRILGLVFKTANERGELDSQAAEIASGKEANAVIRKKLAEQTRDFRKTSDEEKVKSFGVLLKAYQEEIDRLTKKSKFAEHSFLSVYQVLAEAPDPSKGLSALQEETHRSGKIVDLESENRKLRAELDSFKREFSGVKNQEVTIRALEDQLNEYKQQTEAVISERIKGSERQVAEERQKTIDAMNEREQETRRALQASQEETARLQRSLDTVQNEYDDLRSRFEEKTGDRQSEMDMLVQEVEENRHRIAQLLREKVDVVYNSSTLKERQEILSSGVVATSRDGSSPDLELELAKKDIELSQLRDHTKNVEKTLSSERNTSQAELLNRQTRIESQEKQIHAYEEDLKTRPTQQEYVKLKRQLQVLKKATENADDNEIDPDEELPSLEKIFKEKNKKLETENMRAKATVQTLEEQVSTLRNKLAETEANETRLKQLVHKLEEDISHGSNSSEISGQISVVEEIMQQPAVGRKVSEDNTVLQVVTNQRDRFRGRIRDLEEETKGLHSKMQQREQEIDTLRTDNVKLYERIRYLQSYSNSSSGANRRGGMIDIEAGKTDLDAKYSPLYEDSVNPFTLFNRKEKYQRYKDLNPAEKVILNGGQFLLSNKVTRTFLFFYSVLLHLLVFISLYRAATTSANTTVVEHQ
ncbi:hypothetical protein PROFUN_10999 [Planoprotostelium fungivorum]|uniref:Protein CASP n=1 Tax=Planoprotostelium fungivorum TaxID=1890364 RepID=A0A2P6NBY2_9EUKA|nr:hypothetical protein PROFUN_10999 [Planoprotostelium fungivorum]